MKTRVRFLLLITIAAFLIISCEFVGKGISSVSPDKVSEPSKPVNPLATEADDIPGEGAESSGFLPSDCAINNFSFPNITTGSNDYDFYNGPYLICNSNRTGEHGITETMHFSITAIKSESISSKFEEQKAVFQTIVDEALDWKERNPTAGTDVVKIRDEADGYIYLILTNATAQNCLLGEGYGVEIVNDYQILYLFSSCAGSEADYTEAMDSLSMAAYNAISRLENGKNP